MVSNSKLIEKLNKTIEDAYPLFKKHDKEMAVFLHQSINKCADDETLKRITEDVSNFLTYLKKLK
jgi:hypothetical protein